MEVKADRNKEIFKARENGATYPELAAKYGISKNCVRQIYLQEKRKEELKENKYYDILVSLTDNEEMITRTIHVLERNNLDSNEAILNVSRKELLKLRNCGKVMADIILKIAEILQREN